MKKTERNIRIVNRRKASPRLIGDSWKYFEAWLKETSPETQNHYLRSFIEFLEWLDTDTEGLYSLYLEMIRDEDPRKKKRMNILVVDHQNHLMKTKGVTYGTTQHMYKAVKGFFDANELPFKVGKKVTYETKEIPNISKYQISQILYATGSYKAKAYIEFSRDSGMRTGDITNLPIRVVREPLDDRSIQYWTFEWRQGKTKNYANPVIGPNSLKATRIWMDYRVNTLGISAEDGDPLFCVTKTTKGYTTKSGRAVRATVRGDWMDESCMGVAFSQLVRKANLKPLPGETRLPTIHSLRKYHKTTLEYAGVPTSWINKMQGRKGEGTGGIYTKPNPDQLIEMYKRGYAALSGLEEREIDYEALINRAKEEIMLELGLHH